MITDKKTEISEIEIISTRMKGISQEEMIETDNNHQDMKIKEIINKVASKEILTRKKNQIQE